MKKASLKKLRPLIVIGVIVIVVVVTILVGGLKGAHVDLTAKKAATPAEAALAVVRGVNEPVSVYRVESDTTKNVWLDELLARFDAANSNVTVETVDASSARLETLARTRRPTTTATARSSATPPPTSPRRTRCAAPSPM